MTPSKLFKRTLKTIPLDSVAYKFYDQIMTLMEAHPKGDVGDTDLSVEFFKPYHIPRVSFKNLCIHYGLYGIMDRADLDSLLYRDGWKVVTWNYDSALSEDKQYRIITLDIVIEAIHPV